MRKDIEIAHLKKSKNLKPEKKNKRKEQKVQESISLTKLRIASPDNCSVQLQIVDLIQP